MTGAEVVGLLFTGIDAREARRDDILPIIGKCPHSHIQIEEQDHVSYIIHISNGPTLWVLIDADSSLFVELRSRHANSLGAEWGGFIIETADLKQLIAALTGNAVVGQLFTGATARESHVSEILPMLDKWKRRRLAVEQQDHERYLIQAGTGIQGTITWIGISPDSPLFVELRRRHAQWNVEHPGEN
jgi:hypothetical protein